MNSKIFIIPAVLIVVGVGGFLVYQNLSQPAQPTGEKGTGGITEEGALTGEEEINPGGKEDNVPVKEETVGKGETPTESPKTETPEVKSTNPVDILSDALITEWGANCKSEGSPSAIASCLLDWQENNIFWCYINPDAQSYLDQSCLDWRKKDWTMDADHYWAEVLIDGQGQSELNPVRAGLVKNPEDWQFSSFRYYGLRERDSLVSSLIDTDPFYLGLGSNSEECSDKYLENMRLIIKEDFLSNLRRGLDRGIFGRDEFVKEAKDKFKIGSSRPSGRPKKNQS